VGPVVADGRGGESPSHQQEERRPHGGGDDQDHAEAAAGADGEEGRRRRCSQEPAGGCGAAGGRHERRPGVPALPGGGALEARAAEHPRGRRVMTGLCGCTASRAGVFFGRFFAAAVCVDSISRFFFVTCWCEAL
jgi:hypothetical protein